MRVHASKKNPKKLIYVKEIATHAHLVLSLWFLSLQIQFLQPFTPFYGHFCSNRSRQRHHEFSLYHLFLYEFRNPSSVWNDNFLLFFFFEWNLGVLKHNDWICKKIQRHFNSCKYISLTLSTLKNILISFCNLLYIYI